MAEIGRTDVFERVYTEKFRTMLAAVGEFVSYDRDRGVRDIGIHFTRRLDTGGEDLTTALCWFQLKGIMASTLSAAEVKSADEVSLQLRVQHLRYWYMQPIPTYLALYVESVDTFLILNLKRYVQERWGLEVFKLKQETVTVGVPRGSVFDRQALDMILRDADSEAWAQALGSTEEDARRVHRDFSLIWRIGTASTRDVEHRVEILDWQSKMRGEMHFEEKRPSETEWGAVRLHWQLGLRGDEIEATYPYLEFFPFGEPPPDESPAPAPPQAEDEDEDDEGDDLDGFVDSWDYDDDEFDAPPLKLSNGTRARGKDAGGEYYHYELGVRLNALGRDLFAYVTTLIEVGIVKIDENAGEFISVDPWSHRAV